MDIKLPNRIVRYFFISLPFILCSVFSCAGKEAKYGDGLFARIETNRGDFIVRLEYQKVPLTVCNFVGLAEGTLDASNGRPFYNNLVFHRVEANYIVQGGDPLGTGTGGPGYSFPDEFDRSLRHDGPGVLSMANAGSNTNGSQFFITLRATPNLDDRYTVFGKVIIGQDVVNAIQVGDIMKNITIIRNGKSAREFKCDQTVFNTLSRRLTEAAQAAGKAKREADLALIAEKWPSATVTGSGIRYLIMAKGNGAKPEKGDTVIVRYKGMFLSGEVFDASEYHGGSFEFQVGLGMVISGWDKSILEMQLEEKRLVVVPPELAYGERGAGNIIPGNSFLVFEMELLAIRKNQSATP